MCLNCIILSCFFNTGSTVEILCDEDKILVGIVFQDGSMKSTFAAFPEVLLIDATYKLTDLRMPVYLMMVVNGNGQSEIVCVCVYYSFGN